MIAASNTAPEAKKHVGGLRRRVYAVLEQSDGADGVGLALNRSLIALIVVTLAATVVESVPDLAKAYALPLNAIEWTATLVFSLEYAARLWSAAEHPLLKRGAFVGRLRFVLSFPGLIDLAAVLPFWLSVFIASDFRILLVLRLVRFFKLTRYSPAMRSLLDALYSERRALGGCFVILLGTALIAAPLMHLAERNAQPDRFGTIPDALWWAIVTLGTIGYGDVVPVTALGRILASLTIFAGLLMMALLPHNWRGWSSLWATAATRCGENSLAIFCSSVLLSLIGHVILEKSSGALLVQVLVSTAGIALMIATAALLAWAAGRQKGKPQLF